MSIAVSKLSVSIAAIRRVAAGEAGAASSGEAALRLSRRLQVLVEREGESGSGPQTAVAGVPRSGPVPEAEET